MPWPPGKALLPGGGSMMDVLCPNCKHYAGQVVLRGQRVFACLAFPHGIPEKIMTEEVGHYQSYPGDRGYRFEPRYPGEWAAAEKAK